MTSGTVVPAAPAPPGPRVTGADAELFAPPSRVPARPDPPRRSLRSRPLLVASNVVLAVGVLLALFMFYEIFVSALPQRRAQDVLLRDFQTQLDEQNKLVGVGASSGEDGFLDETGTNDTVPDRNFDAAPEPPEPGAPVALLQIPSIGVEQVVVEGTYISQLRDGPGHHRNTVLPGQPGNAAISGPRVANGAPLRDLESVKEGDEIKVTTKQGSFTYKVSEVKELAEGDPDPLRATRDNRLTLMTSAPPYRASHPLIVTAELDGRPVARPAGTLAGRAAPDEDGFSPEPGALAASLILLQLLVAAFFGARWLSSRWRMPVAWLLSAPVMLAILILFYQRLAGLLPATF